MVLACPVSFHFQEHVHMELQEIADAGIIPPSYSPWYVPAVYRMCQRKMVKCTSVLICPANQSYKGGFIPSTKRIWGPTETG